MRHKLVLDTVTEIKFSLAEKIVYMSPVCGGLLRLNWSGFLWSLVWRRKYRMGWIGLVAKVGIVFRKSVQFMFKSNTTKTNFNELRLIYLQFRAWYIKTVITKASYVFDQKFSNSVKHIDCLHPSVVLLFAGLWKTVAWNKQRGALDLILFQNCCTPYRYSPSASENEYFVGNNSKLARVIRKPQKSLFRSWNLVMGEGNMKVFSWSSY